MQHVVIEERFNGTAKEEVGSFNGKAKEEVGSLIELL